MNGRYVGYVAGDDPLHGFLSRIIRDLMGVREAQPAFRAFRLSGSNVVYAYQEKFSHVKIICKFYGPRFGPDLDKAAGKARQEYEGLKTLRRYNLIGSPHYVVRVPDYTITDQRDLLAILGMQPGSSPVRADGLRAKIHNDLHNPNDAECYADRIP